MGASESAAADWYASRPGPLAPLRFGNASANYRRIVADNIKTIFPTQTSLGDVEISGVRLVDHLKGPAWLTCLKVDAGGTAQHYAVFIQGDKVIDWRGGIVIDQCHKETYTPLATATVAKKPGP